MPGACHQSLVLAGSATLVTLGALIMYWGKPASYGKHSESQTSGAPSLPARIAWFLQELPAFAASAGMLVQQPDSLFGQPRNVLLGLFCVHYFHRTFIYSLLTKGRPFPAVIFLRATAFCIGNGLLQAHYLTYCAEYPEEWYTDVRFSLGLFLFTLGMGINIHSDYILRQLRKPGEVIYRIPQGGLFTYVSGANFLGEIIEWTGYALATWSLPAFAFAFFSLCFLALQAFTTTVCIEPCSALIEMKLPGQYHLDFSMFYDSRRFYLKMFKDYPKSRKALIPFIF